MQKAKTLLLVIVLAFCMFALDSLLCLPIARAGRRLFHLSYMSFVGFVVSIVIAVGLVSFVSGLLVNMTNKLPALAALIYLLYSGMSAISLRPAIWRLEHFQGFLAISLSHFAAIVLSVPLALYLAKLGASIKQRPRNQSS